MGTLVVAISEPMVKQIANLIEDIVIHRMGHFLEDTIEDFDEDRFYSMAMAAMDTAIEKIEQQNFAEALIRAMTEGKGQPHDPRQN